MKTIVILGGSFAGVGTAHRILKQTSKTGPPVKVVLVSPNTHIYWNIAAPRAMLPGQFTDEKIFQPIAEGFKQYSAIHFEFILGSAHSLDAVAQKVDISTGPEGRQRTTIDYDLLIIGTGSRNKGEDDDDVKVPFKALGSTEATKDALHDFQAVVKKSKTIVIAGAGPTGVETAGELAFEYGTEKRIILVVFPLPSCYRKSC
jgi:NADH dehydrogenase FAD-containing subunit